MCDAPLIVGSLHQVVKTAKTRKADWSGPHSTAVAGRWRWFACFTPRNSSDQPSGCRVRCEASSDNAIPTKECSDTTCVIDRIELTTINNAYNQRAGKLGVIRVLPEKIATTAQFPRISGTNHIIDIAAAGCHWLAFYYEAQSSPRHWPIRKPANLLGSGAPIAVHAASKSKPHHHSAATFLEGQDQSLQLT